MRISAVVLGAAGGAVGLAAVAVVYLMASAAGALSVQLTAFLIVAGIASLVGIAGGALSMKAPLVGGGVMVVAAIAGAVALAKAFALSSILLLAASALALATNLRAMRENFKG